MKKKKEKRNEPHFGNMLALWEDIILIANVCICRAITLPNGIHGIYLFFFRGRSWVESHQSSSAWSLWAVISG